ncbi:MAG TPA: hypothetical protein VGV17_17010 [Bosea sp. (in: a-proteobacteria)]|uniref:hypothetical protein n=1 Tax=Bosea sp. (in: a-proteobacteria) TaxID=1871050 RepID=UPI002DDCA648|nr:hypothetical protein [Bosea sp. (in: a-proteobacteria)]HEV2555456.1 hypothetical protein [Bosea sp. (in: a-proteobacteria)]
MASINSLSDPNTPNSLDRNSERHRSLIYHYHRARGDGLFGIRSWKESATAYGLASEARPYAWMACVFKGLSEVQMGNASAAEASYTEGLLKLSNAEVRDRFSLHPGVRDVLIEDYNRLRHLLGKPPSASLPAPPKR